MVRVRVTGGECCLVERLVAGQHTLRAVELATYNRPVNASDDRPGGPHAWRQASSFAF